MFFLFGERVRTEMSPQGEKSCPVCLNQQQFCEHAESLWFSLFQIPLLKIEDRGLYWRCENCLNPFFVNNVSVPSHVLTVQQIVVYILLGYGYYGKKNVAKDISFKVTGFELNDEQFVQFSRQLGSGHEEMVDLVRKSAPAMNAVGKQAVIEAAFLTTYTCCDLQYEDRLRINLVGNALGVGLDFVEYAIDNVRKQSYLGIKRLSQLSPPVR